VRLIQRTISLMKIMKKTLEANEILKNI